MVYLLNVLLLVVMEKAGELNQPLVLALDLSLTNISKEENQYDFN